MNRNIALAAHHDTVCLVLDCRTARQLPRRRRRLWRAAAPRTCRRARSRPRRRLGRHRQNPAGQRHHRTHPLQRQLRPRGASGHEVDVNLRCASDSYNFDLTGQFAADGSNHISGQWTERTRNIGGNAIGTARGDRSAGARRKLGALPPISSLVTRGRRQSVTIDSPGGGQTDEGDHHAQPPLTAPPEARREGSWNTAPATF